MHFSLRAYKKGDWKNRTHSSLLAWEERWINQGKCTACMSEGDHLGQCLHFRHLKVGMLYTLSVSEHTKFQTDLSACINVCVHTFCYLAQITMVNCSLSGGLSILIIVTKRGGGLQKWFIPPTLTIPLNLLLMIIMNDLCFPVMCMYLYACHNEKD